MFGAFGPEGETSEGERMAEGAGSGRGRSFDRSLAAVGPMLDWLEEVARAEGIEPNSLRPLQLAIEEVFANCVRHNASGSGQIELQVDTEGSRFRVSITDPDTDGFDPRGAPYARTDLPLEERRPGGLGIHLIRAMVDHIDYRQDGRRAVTVLVKTLE